MRRLRKDAEPRGEPARSAHDAKEWKQKKDWPDHVRFENTPDIERPSYIKLTPQGDNRRSYTGNTSQMCHDARKAWGIWDL